MRFVLMQKNCDCVFCENNVSWAWSSGFQNLFKDSEISWQFQKKYHIMKVMFLVGLSHDSILLVNRCSRDFHLIPTRVVFTTGFDHKGCNCSGWLKCMIYYCGCNHLCNKITWELLISCWIIWVTCMKGQISG